MSALYVIQVAIMLAAGWVIGWMIWRRWKVTARVFLIGTATFILSQVVHVPLVMGITKVANSGAIPVPTGGAKLIFNAIILGLLAGLCEEIARWLVMRFWLRKDRTGADALAFGAGHGGIEAALLGLAAAVNLLVVLNVDSFNLAARGVSADKLELIYSAAKEIRSAPAYAPLLAAAERLFALALHLAASCLVMLAVARRQLRWLVLAIIWHALVDAVAVFSVQRYGFVVTEGALAGFAIASLFIVWVVYPKLAKADRRGPPVSFTKLGDLTMPIRLVGARKEFGDDVVALGDVSFDIAEGSRTCLLGPNGAGKTTSIRLITGALQPSSGLVELFGRRARSPHFLMSKRRVGIVPQQPGMYRDMTVRQYLELTQALYGRGDVAKVIDELQITAYADRILADLSGGMQRRVVLASALLPSPDLLILDEPSAGLDPVAMRDMTEHLKSVSAGRTVLLCTHNLAEAEALCDRVVILLEGRVVLQESIADLRAQLSPKVSLRASGGTDLLEATLLALGHAAIVDDSDVTIALADAEKNTPGLLRELFSRGVEVQQCRIEEASLEEIFLRAVAEDNVASEGES